MARVHRAVTYVHVADVEAALDFYALLGFAPDTVLRNDNGRAFWASVVSEGEGGRKAEMFLARADAPVVPEQQAVIFYMYSDDVQSLRTHLLDEGLHDGGQYCGQPGPNNGRCVVFEVAFPDYMQSGELRVADPDGYCLLIGQLS